MIYEVAIEGFLKARPANLDSEDRVDPFQDVKLISVRSQGISRAEDPIQQPILIHPVTDIKPAIRVGIILTLSVAVPENYSAVASGEPTSAQPSHLVPVGGNPSRRCLTKSPSQ